MTISDKARVALACIRLLNGGLALLMPGLLAKQVGVDPEVNPGVTYVFRMFGVRTVLIGADLLTLDGERRQEALNRAALIHGSDTLAAFLATLSGQFPKKGRLIVGISALNTALAVLANR